MNLARRLTALEQRAAVASGGGEPEPVTAAELAAGLAELGRECLALGWLREVDGRLDVAGDVPTGHDRAIALLLDVVSEQAGAVADG